MCAETSRSAEIDPTARGSIAADSVAADSAAVRRTQPPAASNAVSPGAPAFNPWTPVDSVAVRGPARPSTIARDAVVHTLDLGPKVDVTNEQYVDYQDAFIDTTFLGTGSRLVSNPEGRVAAAATSDVSGTRGAGTTRYHLLSELELGDQLSRAALSGLWRHDPSPTWRWDLDPSAEYRRDRTFGRDRREFRAAFAGHLRRFASDGSTYAELLGRGDLLRTSGEATAFLLDRQTASAGLAVDHAGLSGADWQLGWLATARAFPDSADRDHIEQTGDASWRRVFGSGHLIDVRVLAIRRQTIHIVTVTPDNFWDEEAGVDLTLRMSPSVSLIAGSNIEALQYDLPDSLVYFGYRITRARLGARLDHGIRWSATAIGAAELARSPLAPAEAYDELSGSLECQWLGRGAWWEFIPRAGWRNYASETQDELDGLHSSFAFYELGLIADQPLGRVLRLRISAAARAEDHVDPAQNARSLYLSAELRYRAIGPR